MRSFLSTALLSVSLSLAPSISTVSLAHTSTFSCPASWYGPGFNGNQMANGKRFNMHDDSVVAHKSLPFGTKLLVTNTRNGRQHTVRVQDRGPYSGHRCLDFSQAAAKRLGFLNAGVARISATVIP